MTEDRQVHAPVTAFEDLEVFKRAYATSPRCCRACAAAGDEALLSSVVCHLSSDAVAERSVGR
jgi:hypothetical protein